MAGPRVIFHLDIDAFFASVEQVLDPSLRGRPVIVGGRPGDRSVVASASYEARALGVRTAMPIAQAQRLCPDGVFLRGTFANYQRASERVFELCGRFTPLVEPASIDEGYLDMTGTERLWKRAGGRDVWPLSAAVALRDCVLAETGLHVSIGVGANRLIARVATVLAKPNGICRVLPGLEAAFLAAMRIEAIPGIGPKAAEELSRIGVVTVADLRAIPPALLRQRFGSAGADWALRATGQDDRPVRAGQRSPKSISRESSFERDEPDRGVALAMLYYLVERAAWALRARHLRCRRVAVKIRYADLSTRPASTTLARPADQEAALFAAAKALFSRLDARRLPIRLVGVCLEGLAPAIGRQRELFDEDVAEKRRRLGRAQDAIRARFGFSSLVTGRSVELLERYETDENGFRLRTSCLTR